MLGGGKLCGAEGPEVFGVHSKVLVDDLVSEPDEPAPRDPRMFSTEILRQVMGRLSEFQNLVGYRRLTRFVSEEGRGAHRDELANTIKGLANIG